MVLRCFRKRTPRVLGVEIYPLQAGFPRAGRKKAEAAASTADHLFSFLVALALSLFFLHDQQFSLAELIHPGTMFFCFFQNRLGLGPSIYNQENRAWAITPTIRTVPMTGPAMPLTANVSGNGTP